MRRYNWHSAGSVAGPTISHAKILVYFSNKIYGISFFKQHSETVMVQNADCSLRKKNYCVNYYAFFGTLSFPIAC